jgi:hypothetical protein
MSVFKRRLTRREFWERVIALVVLVYIVAALVDIYRHRNDERNSLRAKEKERMDALEKERRRPVFTMPGPHSPPPPGYHYELAGAGRDSHVTSQPATTSSVTGDKLQLPPLPPWEEEVLVANTPEWELAEKRRRDQDAERTTLQRQVKSNAATTQAAASHPRE